jgi:hypothetical protein
MQNGAPAKIAVKWLQPGFLTAIAMRMVCFAVIQGNPGVVAPSFQEAGLNALTTWDQVQKAVIRTEAQAIDVYENIRFAYRVARQLKEMEREPASNGLRMKFTSPPAQCRAEIMAASTAPVWARSEPEHL